VPTIAPEHPPTAASGHHSARNDVRDTYKEQEVAYSSQLRYALAIVTEADVRSESERE